MLGLQTCHPVHAVRQEWAGQEHIHGQIQPPLQPAKCRRKQEVTLGYLASAPQEGCSRQQILSVLPECERCSQQKRAAAVRQQ